MWTHARKGAAQRLHRMMLDIIASRQCSEIKLRDHFLVEDEVPEFEGVDDYEQMPFEESVDVISLRVPVDTLVDQVDVPCLRVPVDTDPG